jgi:flagellin
MRYLGGLAPGSLMTVSIQTNSNALFAQRQLSEQTHAAEDNQMKLSSGQRITRAGDDPAVLSISSKLRGEVRSLNQALRNTHEGLSMLQTAEGGVTEISNLLSRLRELSVQAASDTVGVSERKLIGMELDRTAQEIDRIAATTQYQGRALLSSFAPDLEIQVGKNDRAGEDRFRIERVSLGVDREGLGLQVLSTENKESARDNLSKVDFAIDRLGRRRSELGALQNRLHSEIQSNSSYVQSLESGRSRMTDVDFAEITSTLTQNQIRAQGNISVMSQANSATGVALTLLGGVAGKSP